MSLIFDCHLDLAWNALTWRRDLCLPLTELNAADSEVVDEKFRGRATTCFPEMRRGKVAVCLATLMGRVPYGQIQVHGSTLDYATHQQVHAFAKGHLAYYESMQRAGVVRVIRTAGELQQHWQQWEQTDGQDVPLGMIISMEGADAIVAPEETTHWFDAGLRVTSIVHYGRSAYAAGTGEEGPLTEAGRQILRQFDSVGMILDVTHLSDESFREAIDVFQGPIVATHQACRTLVPHQRQFPDSQLQAVVDRGGVISVPCDAWMLHPGWIRGETKPEVVSIDSMADQIDYICQLSGDREHVGIGSDLDGGFGTEQTPRDLKSIADLQNLGEILASRGYSDSDINAIFGENLLRFFLKHLPPASNS